MRAEKNQMYVNMLAEQRQRIPPAEFDANISMQIYDIKLSFT
jgi:hypothetical protein